MNKRGDEYTLSVIIDLVLLIIIFVMFSIAAYNSSSEERINNLKAIDLGLTLDAVSSVEGDVSLGYDLGEGMNVGINKDKIEIYQRNEVKMGKEIFVKNSNYNYNDLLGDEYDRLFVIKDESIIMLSGSYEIGEGGREGGGGISRGDF